MEQTARDVVAACALAEADRVVSGHGDGVAVGGHVIDAGMVCADFLTVGDIACETVHSRVIDRIVALGHVDHALSARIICYACFSKHTFLFKHIHVVVDVAVESLVDLMQGIALALCLEFKFESGAIGFGCIAGLFKQGVGIQSAVGGVERIVGLQIDHVETIGVVPLRPEHLVVAVIGDPV